MRRTSQRMYSLSFSPVAAQLLVDVVDQSVRQHVDLLEDHLVDVLVAVVAGSGRRSGRLGEDGQAVLVADHFAHDVREALARASSSAWVMPERRAVCSGWPSTAGPRSFGGHVAEGLDFGALPGSGRTCGSRTGRYVPARKSGSRPPAPEYCTAAQSPTADLAVLQHQQHGDGLAGHRGCAWNPGVTGRAAVDESVLPGALLDGPLVIEEESRRPGCEQTCRFSSGPPDQPPFADGIDVVGHHLEGHGRAFGCPLFQPLAVAGDRCPRRAAGRPVKMRMQPSLSRIGSTLPRFWTEGANGTSSTPASKAAARPLPQSPPPSSQTLRHDAFAPRAR